MTDLWRTATGRTGFADALPGSQHGLSVEEKHRLYAHRVKIPPYFTSSNQYQITVSTLLLTNSKDCPGRKLVRLHKAPVKPPSGLPPSEYSRLSSLQVMPTPAQIINRWNFGERKLSLGVQVSGTKAKTEEKLWVINSLVTKDFHCCRR